MASNNEVITTDIKLNLQEIMDAFSAQLNKDFLTKNLSIRALNKQGVLCYLNGIIDAKSLELDTIYPLMNREVDGETKNNV